MDNVFHFSYVQILQQCALHLPEPNGKIDFVFDYMDDTQYLELINAFRGFRETCPSEEIRRRFNCDPSRRHDHEVLPLQAADLWAGLMRRASFDEDMEAAERIKQFEIDNRAALWDEKKLLEVLEPTVRRNPEILTGIFYEDKKARSKRLKPLRQKLFELGDG